MTRIKSNSALAKICSESCLSPQLRSPPVQSVAAGAALPIPLQSLAEEGDAFLIHDFQDPASCR